MQDENELSEAESVGDEDNQTGGIGVGDSEQEGMDTQAPMVEDSDPKSVKKRLGMQAKKHAREMRRLEERLMQMQDQLQSTGHNGYSTDPYPSPGQPAPVGMNEEERIQHAVKMAMGMQEQQKQQQDQAQKMAHVQKQYQRLNDDFDRASDKYDDFDDVVRGDDVPFTPHVRDAMLLIKNPADVAYQLGKNRNELERISKLHPLDQAREVISLGASLMGGQPENKGANKSAPLGSIRVNPANTNVSQNASASEIRRRMKAGSWK